MKTESGFTLLEVMIAVTILAVISASLFGTFSRTVAARDHAQQRVALYSSARRAIALLENDLGGAYDTGAFIGPFDQAPPRFYARGEAELGTTEDAVTVLDFTAISSRGTTPLAGLGAAPAPGTDRGDLVRVIYKLERPERSSGQGFDRSDERTQLVRYELRPPSAEIEGLAVRNVIAHGVVRLRMRMRDLQGAWQPDWDSASGAGSRAPSLFETRLVVADDDGAEADFLSASRLAGTGS